MEQKGRRGRDIRLLCMVLLLYCVPTVQGSCVVGANVQNRGATCNFNNDSMLLCEWTKADGSKNMTWKSDYNNDNLSPCVATLTADLSMNQVARLRSPLLCASNDTFWTYQLSFAYNNYFSSRCRFSVELWSEAALKLSVVFNIQESTGDNINRGWKDKVVNISNLDSPFYIVFAVERTHPVDNTSLLLDTVVYSTAQVTTTTTTTTPSTTTTTTPTTTRATPPTTAPSATTTIPTTTLTTATTTPTTTPTTSTTAATTTTTAATTTPTTTIVTTTTTTTATTTSAVTPTPTSTTTTVTSPPATTTLSTTLSTQAVTSTANGTTTAASVAQAGGPNKTLIWGLSQDVIIAIFVGAGIALVLVIVIIIAACCCCRASRASRAKSENTVNTTSFALSSPTAYNVNESSGKKSTKRKPGKRTRSKLLTPPSKQGAWEPEIVVENGNGHAQGAPASTSLQ